jgi:hypothetical protein
VAVLQHFLALAIGGAWTGRLYLLAVLFLCALVPMALCRDAPVWVWLPVGLLGVLNPWVYERIVEGQWAVAAAAPLLLVWLAAWEALLRDPGPRRAVLAALAAVLVAAVAVHFAGLVLVLALLSSAWVLVRRRPFPWRWAGLSAGLALVLMLYGILPFLAGAGPDSATRLSNFGPNDFQFFQSTPDPHYGLAVNLIGLQGYWGERLARFAIAGTGPLWPLGALVLAALAVAGAWLAPERRWLLPAGLLGLAIAASTALPGGIQAMERLRELVPPLAGYREPEKWSALWLVALIVLVGEALRGADRLARGHDARIALALAAMLATLVPTGLTAFRQLPATLGPVAYPADWLAARDYLAGHGGEGATVLVLPWHRYVVLGFTGDRLTLNPAGAVFPGRLLFSTDPEIPGQGADLGSPIAVAAAAPDTPGCGLATAARGAGAHLIVVEPILEGPAAVTALAACGYRIVEGDTGRVQVLLG